jgi:hypothetical protein
MTQSITHRLTGITQSTSHNLNDITQSTTHNLNDITQSTTHRLNDLTQSTTQSLNDITQSTQLERSPGSHTRHLAGCPVPSAASISFITFSSSICNFLAYSSHSRPALKLQNPLMCIIVVQEFHGTQDLSGYSSLPA